MSESQAGPSGSRSSTAPDVAASNAANKHVTISEAADDAPDPDEDDLDDLDDLLDEFSAVNIESKTPAATSSGPKDGSSNVSGAGEKAAVPPPITDLEDSGLDDISEEEFQKQLQDGMAELMGDLNNNPEMQSQFEDILKEFGGAATIGADSPRASSSSKTSKAKAAPDTSEKMASDLNADASFQETIRRTMARMQESGDQATAAAAAEGSEDDFIAEMMNAMKDLPGEGGSEEDFTKMLMGMMEQLTNKEILYEPMKELNDKFPDWMATNAAKTSEEDKKRYEEQQRLVKEMVSKFEEPTFKDSNVADREYIVERMQKMQAAGSPPPDLVGDMPSAKEVLNGPDESCAPQ